MNNFIIKYPIDHVVKLTIDRVLKYAIACLIIATAALPVFGADRYRASLSSPDGHTTVTVETGPMGLLYSITVDGQLLLKNSRLGLTLQQWGEIGKNTAIKDVSDRSRDTIWSDPLGKSSSVHDEFSEMTLHLQERSGKGSDNGSGNGSGNVSRDGLLFDVIFRAYNDGIAFRYVLPRQSSLDSFVVEREETTFSFAGDYPCFAGHNPGHGFGGSQEWEFQPGQLSGIPPDSVTGMPLLVHTPAAWIAITEADLLDWAGMWLSGSPAATSTISSPASGTVTLLTHLSPRLDGQGLVRALAPHLSPWRVLMIGRTPGQLIESNLIVNLATPSRIEDPSWIIPGMMAWDHWWSGDVLMNTATIKKYIQLARDMGWPYQLIDWQWYGPFNKPGADITKVNPAVNMTELRRFARAKKVRLWLWLYWTDVDRNDAWEKAFALYEQWGIAGIKIDFMDRDDQEMVNWYEKIAKAAAAHHLMLDFHGAYKPTGLERTYPNQVTREGILGNEYNRWSTRVTSTHKLMLPFTRLLAGPADFTPGGFLNRQPGRFRADGAAAEVQGTRCSQLALFVLYNSPVCVVCDRPDLYRKEHQDQPGADFLRLVPTVWDETHVLLADPGHYLVEARRSGDDWFIGAMTDSVARQFTLPLTFLDKGRYKLQVWKDARDSDRQAEHLTTEKRTVVAGDKLTIPMVLNGGYTARLTKE